MYSINSAANSYKGRGTKKQKILIHALWMPPIMVQEHYIRPSSSKYLSAKKFSSFLPFQTLKERLRHKEESLREVENAAGRHRYLYEQRLRGLKNPAFPEFKPFIKHNASKALEVRVISRFLPPLSIFNLVSLKFKFYILHTTPSIA